MDWEEYRKRGKEMIDYIADYLRNIRSRRVYPDVKPGYMRNLVPDSAPMEGERWEDIFKDVERVVMPGVTHWQSPYMHAYFPALNSFPSLLGDMLADAIGCLGFTWASSPACTELETIVMDWLGKMINLPSDFLHQETTTNGGGVIQTTASEATFVSILAARSETIKRLKQECPGLDDAEINSRLIAYCSDQAHSSVEKAGLISLVKMSYLPTDENFSLRGETFKEAIWRDKEEGLIPFYLCVTLGTTGACAFDNLKELGLICESEKIWIHIDAAYAGTAFICPEYRKYLDGVEYAQSLAFNPSKWMMVHFDCTAMWVKNSLALHRTFNVSPLYLKHENSGFAIDYMHWQVPLSKRFRALKLWFVLRSFGIKGLQKHVRESVRLARTFEGLVRSDPHFEIPAQRILGLVVFRLKGDNELTELLLKRLNQTGKLHMVPASLKNKYVIRFTVTSQYTTETDLMRDWNIIQITAHELLMSCDALQEGFSLSPDRTKISTCENGPPAKFNGEEPLKKKEFGVSLLLANSPMSPKFVNASFAAIYDNNDIVFEFAKQLSKMDISKRRSPAARRRLRGKKQYSLDSRMEYFYQASLPQLKQGSLDTEILEAAAEVEESQEIAAMASENNAAESSRVRSKSMSFSYPGIEEVDDSLSDSSSITSSVREHKKTQSLEFDTLNDPGRCITCKHCGNIVEI